MEVWLHGFAFPGRVSELARRAEDWGFDGLRIADSQNLTADIWIELALAGAATSRLRLGPGVTNPVTRHPAVTASAAATLQAETGGRAVLGFGQGDSALSLIGRRRLSVDAFEHALQSLQGLLRGEQVRLDGIDTAIRWLEAPNPEKVPVHVAATGPRTIAAGARHAEGIDLTVGAQAQRLQWGANIARQAAPGRVSLGAYVNVAVDPDRERARQLVRGSIATFARFSAESSRAGLSDDTKSTVDELAARYRQDRHGEAGAVQARALDEQFIDRFAVVGPGQEVRERLAQIADVGIERLIVVPGSLDSDDGAVQRSIEAFASQVLPDLHG